MALWRETQIILKYVIFPRPLFFLHAFIKKKRAELSCIRGWECKAD